jgi:hypothetical protein
VNVCIISATVGVALVAQFGTVAALKAAVLAEITQIEGEIPTLESARKCA